MKKNIITFLLIFLVIPVFCIAKENKLMFRDSGNRLYYKSNLFDENIFMHHIDMIPGSAYNDSLVIENKTKTNYKLYLKIVEQDISDLANELLDNIEMTIFLDGKLIYQGFAKGLDYNNKGINLQNAIYIGEYKYDTTSKLEIKTKLIPEYSNTENNEFSYIDWEFIANYENDLIVINPDTGDKIEIIIKMFSTILITIIILLIFIKIKIKNLENI